MNLIKGINLLGGMDQEPNIYLIDSEVLIDTGTGLSFGDLKKEIEKNFESYKIKTIVNTHCHHDHTGGDKKFRDWLKASVMIHKADKAALETGVGTLAEKFGETPKIVTVDKTLIEGSTIKTKNFNFKVIHTPGHTPGSICLYDESKRILISGDTLFDEGVGRFDLPGGNKDLLIESLTRLLNYNPQYLLPGHGPPKVGGIQFMIKQMLAHFDNKRYSNYEFY